MGHYVGDPDNYRSDEEKKEGWRNDPIERLANQLKERDFAGDDDLARIRTEIDAAFEKAVAFASQSPEPKPEQALEDLYV
jgi:TPP-dependent pyruvate/acetoin dehydrogenase alpha subunit